MAEKKLKWTENRNNKKKTQHNLYIQKKEVKKFTRIIDITASDDKT